MSYFSSRDPKLTARDAIVRLRTQLNMVEKKEDFLEKRIAYELQKARSNAVSNKLTAIAALRRKKIYEAQLENLAETRLALERQVDSSIESANLNGETISAMKNGAVALGYSNGTFPIDTVGATPEDINAQRELAYEISESVSSPGPLEIDQSDEELMQELADLELEQLDQLLESGDRVPIQSPGVPSRTTQEGACGSAWETISNWSAAEQRGQKEDEEAEIKELEAALAM